MTTFPNSSKFIKTTLQHSTCTCHIFSSFHNVWKLENVVKQNGLWIHVWDIIISKVCTDCTAVGHGSCALDCSCICTCTLPGGIIIILGDWNWALKPTPLKLDKYFFPCPPIFLFYSKYSSYFSVLGFLFFLFL